MFLKEIICLHAKTNLAAGTRSRLARPFPRPIKEEEEGEGKKKQESLEHIGAGKEGKRKDVYDVTKNTVVPKRCESRRGESRQLVASGSLSVGFCRPPVSSHRFSFAVCPPLTPASYQLRGEIATRRRPPRKWILHILSLGFL